MSRAFLSRLYRMHVPHIHRLIGWLELVPFFTHKISGEMSELEKRSLTAAIVALAAVCVWTTKDRPEIDRLHSLTSALVQHCHLPSSACCLWHLWRGSGSRITLGDLSRFDSRYRIEHGETTDVFVSLWVHYLVLIWLLRYSLVLYLRCTWSCVLATVALTTLMILYNNTVDQMLLLKYMVAKRLEIVRKRMAERGPFGVISSVRSLLRMNDKINESYSPAAFLWCSLYFTAVLSTFAVVWRGEVLRRRGRLYDPFLLRASSLLPLIVGHFSVMVSRSSVDRQVDAIIFEMDRHISDPLYDTGLRSPGSSIPRGDRRLQISPIAYRKRVLSLIRELRAVSTDASTLGIFDISCATVTCAIDLLINLVFVFIQFL